MRSNGRQWTVFASVCLWGALLAGCGGGGGGSLPLPPPDDDPQITASALVTSDGGVVVVPAGPIAGARVEIPPGAIPEGEEVNVTIQEASALAADFPYYDGVPAPATRTISLSKDMEGEFLAPVLVTLPFDGDTLQATDGLFPPPQRQKRPCAPGMYAEIDQASRTVTCVTTSFSDFTGYAVKDIEEQLQGASKESFDSGFRPNEDSFFHRNFATAVRGSQDERTGGGNCLAMASFASWCFSEVTRNGLVADRLYHRLRDGNGDTWFDDDNARELIVPPTPHPAILGEPREVRHVPSLGRQRRPGGPWPAALAARKEPQVLLLWRKKTKAEDAFGHAVVVYDYRDGQFCIYDPNYPGEEVTLDWTLDGGFESHAQVHRLLGRVCLRLRLPRVHGRLPRSARPRRSRRLGLRHVPRRSHLFTHRPVRVREG